jgi:hypothetical protein
LRESKDTVATWTKDLSAELSELSKQQSAALEKATFLGMTAEETVEYDNRHARIVQIFARRWAARLVLLMYSSVRDDTDEFASILLNCGLSPILSRMLPMSDYDKGKWVELYRTALMELEHAKMAGRIRDTRIEIAARIEKLHDIPGLHAQEKQAIEDALSGLKVLGYEEARHEADERGIAESALEKLRTLAPDLRTFEERRWSVPTKL